MATDKNFVIKNGLTVGTSEVITSAGNLTNVGTISSSAITSSGNGEFTGTYLYASGDIRVGTSTGATNQTGIIKNGGTTYGLGLFNWGDANPTFIGGSEVNFRTEPGSAIALKSNGTTFLDASRNLTNIGTISSGAITTVDVLTVNTDNYDYGIKVAQATGTGYAPASILLEATSSGTRGQGIYHYNTVNDKNWFTGTFYNDASARWGVAYTSQTSFNSDIAQVGNALFEINTSGNATFAGQIHLTGSASIRSNNIITFNTIGGAAQTGYFKSVAAQTSYANGASDGMFNALNGYAVGTGTGTTVIDSSRNIINANAVGIGTASVTSGYLLHLKSTGDAAILIEADSDNVTETDNAFIRFQQDGGLVATRVGYTSGANSFEIINEYDDSLILGQANTPRLTLTSASATFAGTISSGAITSTGAIQGASFSDGTISGITFIDEDSFATNSATRVPTQQSIKAYVDTQVAGVVDSAPAALDTLNELAAALGDDANFSTTTSTALGNRLRVDTAAQGLTGTQQANAITNLGITATKAELNYVDGVTSNIQTQLDGKQASGSYLTGNQTITLSGDVSGSGTTSIAVTIADDSHNHVISNVDGLQTALDAKLTSSSGLNASNLTSGTVPSARLATGGSGDWWSGNVVKVGTDGVAEVGKYFDFHNTDTGSADFDTRLYSSGSNQLSINGSGRIFTDGYHPNADKWTTARTITLGGDLTGNVSIDGSANVTLTATVADDSHNHVISNVDGLQTALDAKLASSSYTAADVLTKIKTVDGAGSGLDADLLDGISSASFLRSDASDTTTGNLTISKSLPKLILDSISTGDTWTDQGAQLSIGESGDGGSAAMHLTYRGNGKAYIGMGSLSSGIPPFSAIEFTYNSDNIKFLSTPNVNGNTVWHAGNDGSGSGLDADLLDGQQGSYYLNYNNFTNTPTIPSLSGYATESYVGTQISNLVDSAPSTLDTLNELAAALGDDANFSTTVTNSIATKLPLAGGTLTGDVTLSGVSIKLPDSYTEGIHTSTDHRVIDSHSSTLRIGDTGKHDIIRLHGQGSDDFRVYYSGTDYQIFHAGNSSQFTSTLLSKLNGIESGATADQSASEILTAIKTVDGAGSGLDADLLDGISSASFLRSDVSDVYDGRVLEFGNAGNGANTSGAFLTIEGNTDGSGEGSGRLFFREHNSTTASADNYGMSLGYRGGATTVTTAMGNSWTGLTAIGNGQWGMWGHDNNTTGALIMYGDRAATFVNFASNNITGVGNITLSGTVDGRNVATDGTKLDGIEASADVTDSTNVGSALTSFTTGTDAVGSDLVPYYDVSAGVWEKGTITNVALQGPTGPAGAPGGFTTNSNAQVNSLGIGVAATGTAGELSVNGTLVDGSSDDLHVAADTSDARIYIGSRGGAFGGNASHSMRASGGSLLFNSGGSGSNYTFEVNGSNKLSISSAGYVTQPSQPCFGVAKNNGYQTDDAVYVCDSASGTRNHNDGSHYNTSNGRFTAPVAGRYFFMFSVMTHDSGSSATQDWVAFRRNGSIIQYNWQHKTGQYHTRFDFTYTIKLAANDYIEAYVGESGTSPGWQGSASEYNNFSGFLIG